MWDWEKLQQRQAQRDKKDQGGAPPPDIHDIFSRFPKMLRGGGFFLVLLIVLLIMAPSVVYQVEQNEVGIIQRFGKVVRRSGPGLHFKLPPPLEHLEKVPTGTIFTERFGTGSEIAEASYLPFAREGIDVTLMLSGDLYVAVVPWIVQYKIKDPYNYLFKVADVRRLIRDMAEASMRLVVGDRSINEVLTKREEIAIEAKNRLQKDLDDAQTGIEIVTIELENTNVPEPVRDSFNEVNRAIQEKEQMIFQAREAYNKVIPQAKGQAEKTIESAKGYAVERVNRAKGDVARFTALYQEYKRAPEITRLRLYYEMIGDVFPALGQKYIIDTEINGLLPLLDIGSEGKEGFGNAK